MSDLIDRYAAIDVVGIDEEIRCEMCRNPMHTDRGCDGGCTYDEKLYKRIMQILDERIKPLPPAQPEQWWIPCSERLPEIKQHVLLSCYGRVIYGRMISEDGNSGYPVFEICDSVGEKRPIVLETTVHSEFTTSRIIAWMPLPEPYKGGEQDG